MSKYEETWKYLEDFDIIGLAETWGEEETWKKIKDKLSGNYEWYSIAAIRDNKKGRTKGRIIVAVSKEIEGEIKIREIKGNVMDLSFVYNKNRWRMFIVYSQNVEESLKVIMEEVKVRENEEEYLIIEGDLNARTGNEGGPIGNGERKEEEKRRSKDR